MAQLSVPEAFLLMQDRPEEFSQRLLQADEQTLNDLAEETAALLALPDNSDPFSYTKPAAEVLLQHCTRELWARQKLQALRDRFQSEPERVSVFELVDVLTEITAGQGTATASRATPNLELGSCAILAELCRTEMRRKGVHPGPQSRT